MSEALDANTQGDRGRENRKRRPDPDALFFV